MIRRPGVVASGEIGDSGPTPREPHAIGWNEKTPSIQEEPVKAAVVPDFGARLEIRDVPVPEPGPGQVLVKIMASGLCHTDIHAARGDWPVKPKMPLIPGHEGVGEVVAMGTGDSTVAIGDVVALPWLGHACGHCRYCVTGWETYCTTPQFMGYTIDGGYAEYAIGYASHVVKVPEGVSALDAAPLTCAGVTTYKAVKVAKPQPAETAMIVGIGGLGHLALQYAGIFGTTTIAVDVEDEKLQLAKNLGADHVIDGRGDQQAELAALGGVDVAVVTVPSTSAMRAAHAALNPNGRLVLVGLPADNRLELPVFETVLKGISVIGSLVGTRQDLAECFDLHVRGRTKVILETRQLDDVNECFEEVLSGQVPARLVFDMT
jgi:propanol-preferring alcohol dehydrogenase